MSHMHYFDAGFRRYFLHNTKADKIRLIRKNEFDVGVALHGEWMLDGLKNG